MAARRPRYNDISYGELAVYQDAVDEVRKAAIAIAKETRYYQNEAGQIVSDGETFTAHIRPEIARMQRAMRRIDAMSRKWRD